jgi:hypothetical protein
MQQHTSNLRRQHRPIVVYHSHLAFAAGAAEVSNHKRLGTSVAITERTKRN